MTQIVFKDKNVVPFSLIIRPFSLIISQFSQPHLSNQRRISMTYMYGRPIKLACPLLCVSESSNSHIHVVLCVSETTDLAPIC